MPRARVRPRAAFEDDEEEQEQCRCEGCEGRRRRGDAARADADAAAPSALGLAAIRQECGLPRCLVLVGFGLLQELEEVQAEAEDEEEEEEEQEDGGGSSSPPPQQRRREPRLPHLDRVAREGMLTPLQLRDLRPDREGGGGSGDEAVAAQFWGAVPSPPATPQQQQLAARFKGLRALALTAGPDNNGFGAAAAAVGAVVRPLGRPVEREGEEASGGDATTATPERAARGALEALGLLELPTPGPGEAEMVVLHVDAGGIEQEDEDNKEGDAAAHRLRRRRLLRWLDRAARSAFELGGEAARDALLMAVVLTPARDAGEGGEAAGVVAAAAAPPAAVLSGRRRRFGGAEDQKPDDSDPPPDLPRPVQSSHLLSGAPITPLPAPFPLALCARRLPGAVRRGGARRLSARREALARGEGAVLMERLLPELAYKLGRAAKYGA